MKTQGLVCCCAFLKLDWFCCFVFQQEQVLRWVSMMEIQTIKRFSSNHWKCGLCSLLLGYFSHAEEANVHPSMRSLKCNFPVTAYVTVQHNPIQQCFTYGSSFLSPGRRFPVNTGGSAVYQFVELQKQKPCMCVCAFITSYRFNWDFLSKVTYKWRGAYRTPEWLLHWVTLQTEKGWKSFQRSLNIHRAHF